MYLSKLVLPARTKLKIVTKSSVLKPVISLSSPGLFVKYLLGFFYSSSIFSGGM